MGDVATKREARAAAAGDARAALREARANLVRLVEIVDAACEHLDGGAFDVDRASIALELLRVGRADAEDSLRSAQERADLAIDACTPADTCPPGSGVVAKVPFIPRRPRS